MNNLIEKKIEFDVNSKFDENSFDESFVERIKILISETRALYRAFNFVKYF